ncbi:autotransporter family protein [Pasteurellaceae bacterium 22721_9_1]
MLNHIFKTKFDPNTGLSYAISELGKSHKIMNKSCGIILGSFLFILSNDSIAACTHDPNLSASGRTTVICAGDNGAQIISDVNTTLINEGNISSSDGIEPIFTRNSATAFSGINRGTITWQNAKSLQKINSSNAAVNIYYLNNNNQNQDNSFLNDTTGVINVIVADAQQKSGAILGIANNAKFAKAYTENKGTINITANTPNNSISAITGAGKEIEIINSGNINVKNSQGDALGVTVWGADSEKVRIINSGNITSSSTKYAVGIELQKINQNVQTIEITNQHYIKSSYIGIGLLRFTEHSPTATIVIKNTENGVIEIEDKTGFAAITFNDYSKTTPVHITNAGKLINRNKDVDTSIITVEGNDLIQNTGEILGGIYTQNGDDQMTSSAGIFNGYIVMGKGNDKFSLSGTDIANLIRINGGLDSGESLSDSEENTFVLNQNLTGASTVAGEPNNTKISNWTTINVAKDKEATLTLTGDLLSGKPNDGLGNMTIGTQGKLALAPNTATSTVGYNVVNEGKIDLVNATPPDQPEAKMTIKGNYEGKVGSQVLVKSVWNNPDVQKNDLLVIEGNATGATTVVVPNKILGDVTRAEAEKNGGFNNPVITVKGTDSGTFTGSAETTNAGEAQLKREGNSYYWTLKAKLPTPTPPAKPSDPANPSNPVNPDNPVAPTTPVEPETVDIISKPVVGYVQQPFINRQMGLAQLGKLHERVGEQRNAGWENGNALNQVWGRMNLDSTALQGRDRFGADVKSGFVQFGRDIDFKLNDDKSQQHTGLTFTYGWANSKFFDKYNAENGVVVGNKFTGSAKSDMLSIGGYHTYYSPAGAYLDLVGQVSWLQNRYRSGNTQVKQNGYGLGASIEVGKPYHLLNPQVTVEPQAQLSYQSIWLNGFNDGIRQVKKSHQDSLVGRLGVRVNWSETLDKNSPQVYFTANLIQTLSGKGSTIQVGREQVKERFGDLAAEFGLGGQYPINQNLSVYADARYVIGIQDRNRVHRDSSVSRKSYNGHIGVRYSW